MLDSRARLLRAALGFASLEPREPVLASLFGGFGPGVLATILAALSLTVLWLPPLDSLRIQRLDDASALILFVAIGFEISLFRGGTLAG